ncbi:hypothetical protein [Chitinophaga nivalis]|uniref:PKD domain-containing protein n=1 Tax=Chitinophaga nivalis TaxID=2991709 RepID=A0ABT3IJL5_9BACT|nr:hypothetical protein [Chitinophaga nivalis]MCW3466157.1 hypothetical protein [Chitinophaga nivalis]MCW3484152.1 hypothetical protein [Chitinophaga nivalis]
MSSNQSLFVPMLAEALVVSMDQQALERQKITYADVRPRLAFFDQSILGDTMQADGQPLPAPDTGIHLHWQLPKALKHAFVGEQTDADMDFPYAPNRWMVIRYRTDSGVNAIPAKAWIIESDYINNIDNLDLSESDPNFLSSDNQQLSVQKIGRCLAYIPGYKNTPAAQPYLTAVTPGNPYFAAFYPGCRHVFGFYDDMKDEAGTLISTGTFTYVITGWYDDPATDPLYPLPFTAAVNPEQEMQMKKYHWFKEKWQYSGTDYPEQSVFHAAVHSVAWAPNTPPGVPAGPVGLAVGNTAAEAFSAKVLKEAVAPEPQMEELLNALQYQLLEDDEHPVGIGRIQEEIHTRGFHTQKGGIRWEINRCESDHELGENDAATQQFPDLPGVSSLLQDLNKKQQQLNLQQRTLLRWQQEYYSLWYKQALDTIKNFRQDIAFSANKERLRVAVTTAKAAVAQLTNEVAAARQQINELEPFCSSPAVYELKQQESPAFWEVNDPVLLLWGQSIGDTHAGHPTSQEADIRCRTIAQIPAGLEVTIEDAMTVSVTVPSGGDTFKMALLNNLSGDVPVTAIQAICYEAMLFDQSFASDLALTAFKIAGIGNGKDKADLSIIALGKTIADLQANLPERVTTGATYPAPAFAIMKWQQAWHPLFLSWKVAFQPAFDDIRSLDFTHHPDWYLQDNLFYRTSKAILPGGPSCSFNAITPLSNAVWTHLKRIAPDVNKYDGQYLMAQSLGGFHKYLLMQQPDLQFPPLNYRPDNIYHFDSDYRINQEELTITGTAGYRLGVNPGPLPTGGKVISNNFFPLRAGEMALLELRIIDVFGQVKNVLLSGDANNPVAITAGQLSPLPGAKLASNSVSLCPRIVQPSRIAFEWLDAQDEVIYAGSYGNSSPVFGWVIPHLFDNLLMVYDQDGKEVLLLQLTTDPANKGGIGLIKKPFPGSDVIPAYSDNKHLSDFINAISNPVAVAGLIDLAIKVNLKVAGTAALQHNVGALIAGQPLALARCGVGLESMGFPFNNQAWGKESNPDNGDITDVTFPLFLGDFNRDKDGLVGYMVEGDRVPGFNTCSNAPDFINSTDAFYRNSASVGVSLNQSLKAMTLLLDPSAGIHISSGILPVHYRELHPYQMNGILSRLNTSFMAAPFLAEKVQPGMPVPAAIGADWTWVHKTGVSTWEPEAVAQASKEQPSRFVPLQAYEGWLKFKPNAGKDTLSTKLTFMADIEMENIAVHTDQPTVFITEHKPVDIELQLFPSEGQTIALAGAIEIDGLSTIIKAGDWASLQVDLYGLVPGKDTASQIPIASFDVGSSPGKITHILGRKVHFTLSVLILKIKRAICEPPQALPGYALQVSYFDNPAVNPDARRVTVPVIVQQQGIPEVIFRADPQVLAGGATTTFSWAFADKTIDPANAVFSIFDVGNAKDILVDGSKSSFATNVGIGDHTYRLTVTQQGVSQTKTLQVRGLNTQTTGYINGPGSDQETVCNVCVSKDESMLFSLTVFNNEGGDSGIGSIYYTADGFSDVWTEIKLLPGELAKLADFATSPVVHLRGVGDTFGQLIFCGGSYSVLTQVAARTAIADLDTGLVRVQDCSWPARMGHSCVVFNPGGEDRICLIGGLDAFGNALQDMWASSDGMHWDNLDTSGMINSAADPVAMPWRARCFLGAAVEREPVTKVKKALWIGGGFAEEGGRPLSDIWKLEAKGWKQIMQSNDQPLLFPEPYLNTALVFLGKDTRKSTGINYMGVAATAGKAPFFSAVELDVSGRYLSRDRIAPFEDMNSVPFNKILPFYYKNCLWFMAMAYQGDDGVEYTGVLSWYIAKPGSVIIQSDKVAVDMQ